MWTMTINPKNQVPVWSDAANAFNNGTLIFDQSIAKTKFGFDTLLCLLKAGARQTRQGKRRPKEEDDQDGVSRGGRDGMTQFFGAFGHSTSAASWGAVRRQRRSELVLLTSASAGCLPTVEPAAPSERDARNKTVVGPYLTTRETCTLPRRTRSANHPRHEANLSNAYLPNHFTSTSIAGRTSTRFPKPKTPRRDLRGGTLRGNMTTTLTSELLLAAWGVVFP